MNQHAIHPSFDQLVAFDRGLLAVEEWPAVDSHVAACGRCCEKLEELPDDYLMALLRDPPDLAELPSRRSAADVADADEAIPAALLDHPRYRVLALLGRGGMGTVYRAEHRLMGRVVAVKLINNRLLQRPDCVERFRREIRAAARLQHPNIVHAYDAEQVGDSQLLVMEYVEGRTLDQVVNERGPLPIQEACRYVRQAATGLEHARERGMVHRDIKPHNLLLTPAGEIKILDFGLSRFASEETPPSSLTESGVTMGTPDYLAPEQALDPRAADIRADIYSLGCTLYFLLSGAPPYPEGAPLQKVLSHQQQTPVRVSVRRPGVPIPLQRVVATMMAKDSAQRYQTPGEVASSLEPWSRIAPEGEAADSQVPHPASRVFRLAALAVVSLLAIVGASLALRQGNAPQAGLIAASNDEDFKGDDRADPHGNSALSEEERAASDKLNANSYSGGAAAAIPADADEAAVSQRAPASPRSPQVLLAQRPKKKLSLQPRRKTAAVEPPPADPPPLKIDWSTAEEVSIAAPAVTWQVEIAAVEPLPKPKTAPLPKKASFFEGVKGIAANPTAGKAAVSFAVGDPRPAGTTRVVLCDLATGKTGVPATASGQMAPLALHDDGKQLVMRRDEFGFGNQDRLEVWTVEGPRIVKTLICTPYEDANGGARDILWGAFLDEEHLATSSRAGKVVVWSFPEMTPLRTLASADGAVPALSPDRHKIAYCDGKQIGIYDVARDEIIAQQPTPLSLQWPYLAFSPSGRRLGCIAFDKVLVWDVATGKLERTIPCPGLNIHGAIDFPDENFILGAGKFLIDVEHQLKLWTYEGHEQVRCVAGWTYFAVTNGEQQPGALLAAQIPHAAAKDLLQKSLADPNLFVLKPGTTVKVNVSGIPDSSQQLSVSKALADRLKTIDCQPGDNGTIELIATMEGPKERQISYFGSGDYKVKEYMGRVKFVYQGQTAWETAGTNVPFVISLKRGENIGDHLRSREVPDYAFFSRVELPKLLQKPSAGQQPGGSLTLGQSRVTTSGIR